MSTILKMGWFYQPVYFIDNKYPRSPGTCTLLTRHATLRQLENGQTCVYVKSDGHDFPDEAAMVAWIEEHQAEELPEWTSDPRYLPDSFLECDPVEEAA